MDTIVDVVSDCWGAEADRLAERVRSSSCDDDCCCSCW